MTQLERLQETGIRRLGTAKRGSGTTRNHPGGGRDEESITESERRGRENRLHHPVAAGRTFRLAVADISFARLHLTSTTIDLGASFPQLRIRRARVSSRTQVRRQSSADMPAPARAGANSKAGTQAARSSQTLA